MRDPSTRPATTWGACPCSSAKTRGLLHLLRVVRLPQAGLRRRVRAGARRGRPRDADGYRTVLPRRRPDEDMRVSVGVLRLPQLQLRGRQRRDDALPQRRRHGARRESARRLAGCGLRGRRAGLRRAPRHRLRHRELRHVRAPFIKYTPLGALVSCPATRTCATTWQR